MNIETIATLTGGAVVTALKSLRPAVDMFPVRNREDAKRMLVQLHLKPGLAKISATGVIERYRGDVDLGDYGWDEMPLRFELVDGDFSVIGGNLRTLEGCPKITGGAFIACRNQITSLEHGPEKVGKRFDVSDNLLMSLDHGPLRVGTHYVASRNPGCPFAEPKGVARGTFYGGS